MTDSSTVASLIGTYATSDDTPVDVVFDDSIYDKDELFQDHDDDYDPDDGNSDTEEDGEDIVVRSEKNNEFAEMFARMKLMISYDKDRKDENEQLLKELIFVTV